MLGQKSLTLSPKETKTNKILRRSRKQLC